VKPARKYRHEHPDGTLVETAEMPDGRVVRTIGGWSSRETLDSAEMRATLEWFAHNFYRRPVT
jgi:hypothetical protein